MYDICTIGPISNDTIINADTTRCLPGGTAYYVANALQQFPLRQQVITVLEASDHALVEPMRVAGIDVHILPSHHTVSFENKYSADQSDPEQRVRHQSSPFSLEHMPALTTKLVHLGPLLSQDIPLALLETLAQTNRISLDIQGYLRDVRNHKVVYRDWAAKKQALPLVNILKANEMEMGVLTGQKSPREGALYLADMGVEEVVITLGKKGSLVYSNGTFHTVRAFSPTAVVDTTGCGDTYMAGYLAQRVQGVDIPQAAEFGAAMASLKVSTFGPFCGPPEMVESRLNE
ncbi:PfkB family carbohydrate kinase [Spirosoma utsteinense]|uniref:Sugar/nucleoside kinase (Ribokinase family) n=1 Tax=Spirosoma utsteinense TaxID=2585773 RepID=A0ABR6W9L4_9BACT|nr:PfkB family carbohydrate kinase [Spirosoma utsteinense]MBC3787606.1 sugar/nucleoside kinase (ribokinase family) [Spirosoma utsteinense]MBC3793202.1 sugar/nucleoside kinase (ribokinase family) [Spirosoma utsteinense]